MKYLAHIALATILAGCGTTIGGVAPQPYMSVETVVKRISPKDKSVVIEVHSTDEDAVEEK